MSTESKELPEGWEEDGDFLPGQGYARTDGAWVHQGDLGWSAFPRFMEWLPGHFPTAQAAMEALDREYPMEKRHGD